MGFFSLSIKITNFFVLLSMLVTWHVLFKSFHLYRSRRLESGHGEVKDILKATTLGTSLFMLIGLVFSIEIFTPSFALTFWLISTCVTIAFRCVRRYLVGKRRSRGRNSHIILIVGTNQKAYEFAQKIKTKKELGYHIIGFVDNTIHENKDLTLLGTLADFPSIIRKKVVDEVIIFLPVKSYYNEIQQIVREAERQGILVRYSITEIFTIEKRQPYLVYFEGFAFLASSGYSGDWTYISKRAFDIFMATVLIIIAAPLMLFSAIIIKCTSPGPVFFVQDRVGYNKRSFRFCKFRTMKIGSEKLQAELSDLNVMDGPVFKINDDPRITKTGKWLRKWCIDETPQLFNVLIGNMSMVGPRPLDIIDFNKFSYEFDQNWLLRRFGVFPGITGSWQVVDNRNRVLFEDWMKMDMEYIDNWTFFGDLKIMLKTILVVIKGNSY